MWGFPSASVPGWNSSRLPTDYVGMADVSRRARGRSTLSAADAGVARLSVSLAERALVLPDTTDQSIALAFHPGCLADGGLTVKGAPELGR